MFLSLGINIGFGLNTSDIAATGGGGVPAGALQDDSGNYLKDDAGNYIIGS